jgi:hypothetical protein
MTKLTCLELFVELSFCMQVGGKLFAWRFDNKLQYAPGAIMFAA